ncbi:MAG: ATP-binding protein [Candidatus Muiribacteriota bacterium]
MASITTDVYNCIQKYELIKENDNIAVGISGGKDSATLLHVLGLLKKKLKINLTAIHIIPRKNYEQEKIDKINMLCEKIDVPVIMVNTNILDYIEELKLKKDICFLCAQMRRKELFLTMSEKKIYKLALGHHRNDAIETFMMNIFYSAQVCTMMPKQSLFRGKIEIIRPLYTVREKRIESYSKTNELPVFGYCCMQSEISKRKEMKDMIAYLSEKNPKVEYNIFNSMHNINLDYLPKVTGINHQKN